MKFVKAIAAALVLGALSVPAMAQDEEKSSMLPGTFTGNIALANDYMFRGYSQTLNSVAVQGGLDWDSGMGIYLGTWASNVDFGTDGHVEWDLYGGFKHSFGDLTVDVGAVGYLYPDAPKALNLDYWEAKLALGYALGPVSLTAAIYYSPDYTLASGDTIYYMGGASATLLEGLSISGNIGKLNYSRAGLLDVVDYNIGASYAFEWFTADVRWYDTDAPAASCTFASAGGTKLETICDSRVVFSVKRSF